MNYGIPTYCPFCSEKLNKQYIDSYISYSCKFCLLEPVRYFKKYSVDFNTQGELIYLWIIVDDMYLQIRVIGEGVSILGYADKIGDGIKYGEIICKEYTIWDINYLSEQEIRQRIKTITTFA